MKINNLATPIINNNIQNNQGQDNNVPAFKGKFADSGWHPKNLLNLDRAGAMKHNLFIANAFVFLLGSRIFTSRDKDEYREILIRDIPSIIIAVVGVDSIEKAVAKWVHKNKGFALMTRTDDEPGLIAKAIGKIRNKSVEQPLKGVTYSRLKDWYVYDENIQAGLKGFSERLTGLGGDLKTIYSRLNDSIKGKLAACTDNNSVMALFSKDKDLEKNLIDALKKVDNKALKRAETLKTIPTVIGFALTLGLLGFIIPKLNIHITETISKNRQKQAEAQDNQEVAKAA